ncbi:uncharacterized protein LOC131659361 [Vicia villosa]|uniref:uncharacterized protein LOC131659361 n=1 Tax=Vicia villosa TaxID=3911 RepID=UPI00273B01FF|nr:uncharacterized protein LOC131659361 [Vicia villosa]
MVIQEESNIVALLPKHVDDVPSEEIISLANASDSRNYQDRSRPSNSSNFPKKDGRLCTYFHKIGHTIDVCYKKHDFPPSFGKMQVSTNATNVDNGESHQVSTGAEDSGVNDHVCSSLHWFSFYHKIKRINDVKSKRMIGLASAVGGLYRLVNTSDSSAGDILPSQSSLIPYNHHNLSLPQGNVNNCKVIPNQAIWHFRLGHLSHERLSKMSQLYPQITCNNKDVYDICHFAKQKKLPFNSSLPKAEHVLELIHFDIWGPISTNFIHGHRYFLTILDDFNRFVWIILLKSKLEVSNHFQHFVAMIEK